VRYVFRLATVLRVRRAEEQRARAALMVANASLVGAIEDRDEADARYRAQLTTVSDAASLVRERCDAELAAATLERAQRRVSRAASEAALARVEWSGAARRVAMLERLDERRRAEHLESERRREAVAVDDLVAGRRAHARQTAARQTAARQTAARQAAPRGAAPRDETGGGTRP